MTRSDPAHGNHGESLPPAESYDGSGAELPPGMAQVTGGSVSRIGWRRKVLLLAAVLGCLTVFLLARVMANNPHLDAEWRTGSSGHLELLATPLAALQGHIGSELQGYVAADDRTVAFDVLALTHSGRWITDDQTREHLLRTRLEAARQIEAGQITLAFTDGSRVDVQTVARGYGKLGAMFWMMCAFAMVLFLVGWIVPLVQPQFRNLLYGVMAQAQSGQLLVSAISAVPALALPSSLVPYEVLLRTALDLVTGAAIVHAATQHPTHLPWRRVIAGLTWLATGGYVLATLAGALPNTWWWGQSLMLGDGALCVALLSWSNRRIPHPFAVVMRRICVVTLSTLALLTLAVSMLPLMPPEMQPVAAVGPVIWGVFFASVILLVPFISRTQNVMREFAMLAGVSTVATSIDLLFVAAFSFSQFASLTLSLFLALGAYAAIRQWLVTQMMGARALTTERMFEHLYRIAREVEAKPERAADRMIELLGNVFEPLDTVRGEGRSKHSHLAGNGSVLLVPLPNLMQGPSVDGLVALRFAERGKRLFTQEDAKLADRILEQLMRALAHDRAVESGRSEERTRIAQDLHDDIGARLLTLMYKSQSKEMEDYVRHTLQDLKTLTRGLAAKKHPLTLAAAEWKTDASARLAEVGCDLSWSATFDLDITLSIVQWSSLTRILRELISNVISHAKAGQVQIDLQLEQGLFTITMADDGAGRSPEKWSHGLGLGGIRKRVKLMGGTVRWSERAPRGITCEVVVPELLEAGAARMGAAGSV
jgi:signal transduction histidine kinase